MKVKVIINQKKSIFDTEKTLLQNINEMGIEIPTLCHHEDISPAGVCKVCSVEIAGRGILTSCDNYPEDGMELFTHSEEVEKYRKNRIEEILKDHSNDCLTCEKAMGDCELQNISYEYGVENRGDGTREKSAIDNSSSAFVRDMNKCIKCQKCVKVCDEIQGIGVYCVEEDGSIGMTHDTVAETDCISCGQCVKICPVGALHEKIDLKNLNHDLKNPMKHIVVQMAPAIKNTIGEEFGILPGTDITKKMVAALKDLGFDRVFSTDFSADVTIMEEGTEFLDRFTNGGKLPMFTSCCPGWINYAEINHPEFLDNLSSCKSPQQIFGALSKSYYSKISGVEPSEVYSVSIMPCTAKKDENIRDTMMDHEGNKDVDMVITTRELAKLFKLNKINLAGYEKEEEFDRLLGEGTGAARIFASTGGVMEAALRTVSDVLGETSHSLEYKEVRGFEGVRRANLVLAGKEVNVAVINGIKNATPFLESVKKGETTVDFVEVMACVGGCLNGGGAPAPDNMRVVATRKIGLYDSDEKSALRKSHENLEVKKLYEDFLGKPGGHKSHHLLHTHYKSRKK
ncbi:MULTISPECIES: [FeFe] hydrogenase, group A [Psychrilyobacter]|uniref:Ferredoxin n=1 Tax=Psychrilyobacter piezotolerans TaxID=2293438 RepID=A0ABX9KIT9_9FUSO|nr:MULTISPECIES: [FeFe] hydrogenase, group A [Psychrilyobacter]MCS5421143.1 [FeFe] hydrogenase, group A [Psychrilyobacter sp. S5]NDI77085.1 ferredoxin [Psychrilyobacter piezotolerans]RDE64086.1 ferredoxin [Psychrilyobacter sp. S5]REI42178.1 ferredoxin [Psychrilyobacter piezotolerans]